MAFWSFWFVQQAKGSAMIGSRRIRLICSHGGGLRGAAIGAVRSALRKARPLGQHLTRAHAGASIIVSARYMKQGMSLSCYGQAHGT
jgi:hypothetical protein